MNDIKWMNSMKSIYGMNSITIRQAHESDIQALTEQLCELYEDHSYDELIAENRAHFKMADKHFSWRLTMKRLSEFVTAHSGTNMSAVKN